MKKYIEIKTDIMPLTIPAIVRGNLAIHRSIKNNKFWTITYVPTGLMIASIAECVGVRRMFRMISIVPIVVGNSKSNKWLIGIIQMMVDSGFAVTYDKKNR